MSDYDDLSAATDNDLWQRLAETEGLARADVLLELGRRAAGRDDEARALALISEAASVAEQAGDLRLAAFALHQKGNLRFSTGQYAESAAAHGRAAEHSRSLGRSADEAIALCGQADSLRALGDWEGAAQAARSSRSLAEAEGMAEVAGDACLIQAKALYFLDRDAESLIACSAGRDHYRSVRLAGKVARIDDFALTVQMYLGDLDEALELARTCHVLARTSQSGDDDAYASRRLAEVHLRREEWDAALEHADIARGLYRRNDVTLGVARCDVIRGRVLRARGDLADALAVFTEARVLFDSTGADGEALECETARAILLHALGRYREAAAVNRHVIDFLVGTDHPMSSDLPWAVGRLADNLLAAEDAEGALGVIRDWDWLWQGADGDAARVSRLCLLEVQARVLVALDRLEQAAGVVEDALALTTEADLDGRTADLYDIRAQWLMQQGDARGRQELAHAIALHLAFGSTRRAAQLSQHFLPEVGSSRREGTEGRQRMDEDRDRPA